MWEGGEWRSEVRPRVVPPPRACSRAPPRTAPGTEVCRRFRVDAHVSQADDLDAVERQLDELGIRYVVQLCNEGDICIRQLFFHDPGAWRNMHGRQAEGGLRGCSSCTLAGGCMECWSCRASLE